MLTVLLCQAVQVVAFPQLVQYVCLQEIVVRREGCMCMCACVYVCCWYATTKPVNMPLTMPPSMIEWLSVCTPVTLYKRCLSRCLYCMLCHEFSPSPTPTSPDLQSLTPNNGLYPRPKPIFQVGEVITIIF